MQKSQTGMLQTASKKGARPCQKEC